VKSRTQEMALVGAPAWQTRTMEGILWIFQK
jgi:hypothetical protein